MIGFRVNVGKRNMHTLKERPASFVILSEDEDSASSNTTGNPTSSWLNEGVYTGKQLFRIRCLGWVKTLNSQHHLQVRREDQWFSNGEKVNGAKTNMDQNM